MQNNPIGIFDSGIGGLTVANAIREVLPNESLVYFGDTEHLPYGDKSASAIQHFSTQIAKFLVEKGCKAIVMACNSASSTAFRQVQAALGPDVPLYNVIDPAVAHLSALSQTKVGVIGTKATIQSGVYGKELAANAPQHEVCEMATPLLAHMIEEGFHNKSVEQAVISEYLSAEALTGIKQLVLACTHYPLIQDQIAAFYKGEVEIINSANLVAQSVRQDLENKGLLSLDSSVSYKFYVSDYTASFDITADHFFGEHINLEEVKLWA